MDLKKSSTRPGRGARIKDRHRTSLIREERENHAFPFPWSEKTRIGLFATLFKRSPKTGGTGSPIAWLKGEPPVPGDPYDHSKKA